MLCTLAVLAAACAVDSSGVIRASEGSDPDPVTGDVTLATDECTDLLRQLQEEAVALVGPNGFIGTTATGQFNPVFRGFGGIGFGEFGVGVGGDASAVSVGESAVAVGDHLAVVQDGRLYLYGPDGTARGSVWLDALAERRWPAVETGLLVRPGELVAVSPGVTLRDEAGDPYLATVIQRVDIEDPAAPAVVERMTVRGEVAGAVADGDAVRIAVAVPPPALDFLYASTAGGEDAATSHNQGLLADTTLADWLGGYELTVPGADGEPTVTSGLLGGCEALAAEGAAAALGATVLIDLGPDRSLADLDATTVLGQGRVSFGTDATYVLSPRSHAVGFAQPGQQGSPRVIISRLVDGDDGPTVDGIGIIRGSLSALPSTALADGHLLVFTNRFDNFGNGGFEAATLRVTGGEIVEVDTATLPVQPWDTLTVHEIDGAILVSGQQGSALIDASDPADLDVAGIEARWDLGNFVGAPQLAPYRDGSVLSIDPGPVASDFGGVENFIQNIAFGEFGFGWEPWNDSRAPASIRIVEGDPITGDVVAEFQTSAFALWPLSADGESGEIVVGVIGLTDDDGNQFDGALLLRHEGDRLVEVSRWDVEAPAVENFGATMCEKTQIDGIVLDVLGLWNQTPLQCDPGVPGGMVGHTCTALTIPEISPNELRNWFGFDDPDAIEGLDELLAAAAAGSTFQGCTPRQAAVPTVVRGHVDAAGGDGRWLVGPAAVHRIAADGSIAASTAIEPPYVT